MRYKPSNPQYKKNIKPHQTAANKMAQRVVDKPHQIAANKLHQNTAKTQTLTAELPQQALAPVLNTEISAIKPTIIAIYLEWIVKIFLLILFACIILTCAPFRVYLAVMFLSTVITSLAQLVDELGAPNIVILRLNLITNRGLKSITIRTSNALEIFLLFIFACVILKYALFVVYAGIALLFVVIAVSGKLFR